NPEKQMASPNLVTPADNPVTPTSNLVIPSAAEGPALHPDSSTSAPTLPIPGNRNALYNSEPAMRVFREIDKRYTHSPDYGQRTSEALDALLHGGPVHDWLQEILKSTGFTGYEKTPEVVSEH